MRLLILLIAGLVALLVPLTSWAIDAPIDAPPDRFTELNVKARAANVDLADCKRRTHLAYQALQPSMFFWPVTYGTFAPPAVSRQGWIFNPTMRPTALPAQLDWRFSGKGNDLASPGR